MILPILETRAKILPKFGLFFWDLKTPKFLSEVNWPLEPEKYFSKMNHSYCWHSQTIYIAKNNLVFPNKFTNGILNFESLCGRRCTSVPLQMMGHSIGVMPEKSHSNELWELPGLLEYAFLCEYFRLFLHSFKFVLFIVTENSNKIRKAQNQEFNANFFFGFITIALWSINYYVNHHRLWTPNESFFIKIPNILILWVPCPCFHTNQQLFLRKTEPLFSKSQIFIWVWHLDLGHIELGI